MKQSNEKVGMENLDNAWKIIEEIREVYEMYAENKISFYRLTANVERLYDLTRGSGSELWVSQEIKVFEESMEARQDCFDFWQYFPILEEAMQPLTANDIFHNITELSYDLEVDKNAILRAIGAKWISAYQSKMADMCRQRIPYYNNNSDQFLFSSPAGSPERQAIDDFHKNKEIIKSICLEEADWNEVKIYLESIYTKLPKFVVFGEKAFVKMPEVLWQEIKSPEIDDYAIYDEEKKDILFLCLYDYKEGIDVYLKRQATISYVKNCGNNNLLQIYDLIKKL